VLCSGHFFVVHRMLMTLCACVSNYTYEHAARCSACLFTHLSSVRFIQTSNVRCCVCGLHECTCKQRSADAISSSHLSRYVPSTVEHILIIDQSLCAIAITIFGNVFKQSTLRARCTNPAPLAEGHPRTNWRRPCSLGTLLPWVPDTWLQEILPQIENNVVHIKRRM
jgi:hypothetical protein